MNFRQIINALITLDRQRHELLWPRNPYSESVSPESVLQEMEEVIQDGYDADSCNVEGWWICITDMERVARRVDPDADIGIRQLAEATAQCVSDRDSADVAQITEWRDQLIACIAKAEALEPKP